MAILRNSFNTKGAPALFQFTQGIDLDVYLAREEIQVQLAWADALANLGYLSAREKADAETHLSAALEDILHNRFEWRTEDEDIHMNLERYLTEKAGELGKKIHFGRSRNDLIATTLRLFVARMSLESEEQIRKLIASLIQKAESDTESFIPGQTHLQHGQPIRTAHFWLAHAQAFCRDLELFQYSKQRSLKNMPLGSGALSGVSLAIPLRELAKKLGFESAPLNSYDSIGDRDFILDYLRAISGAAIHLSRLSEDIIFYSSTAVGLFSLPKDYSTGSSMMPNKRNPDVAELGRAKSAHMMSAFNNASLLMKGLPSSYNSDLHELKRVLLNAIKEFQACFEIFPFFVEGIALQETTAKTLLSKGHILATFHAENKVLKGKNFRDAYSEIAAEIAKSGAQANIDSAELSQAVEAKNNSGGTALGQIEIQIQNLKTSLSL